VSGRHIALFRSYRCTIRDSYFHHAWAYTSGGLAYGISIAFYSSNNLIENNIVYNLNFPIALENSGGGNVIAYNYTEGAWLNEGDKMYQMADIGTHCDYPHMELFEGNWSTHVCPDYEHGGSGYLTFYRNHLDGVTSFPKDTPPMPYTNNNNGAFDIRQMNVSMNFVGNVLLQPGATGQYECFLTGAPQCNSGITTRYAFKFQNTGDIYTTAYRQGNYDYITNSAFWINSIEETLPNSLYLTSKPAFFGSLAWPAFGPDLNPMVGQLPAKVRFDAMLPPPPEPTPPVPSPASTSGGGGGCFIARAAYGSSEEPHVKVLRDFRDRYMMSYAAGRAVVDIYYRHAPGLAEFVERHDTVKTIVRWALLPLVAVCSMALNSGSAEAAALFFVPLAGIITLASHGLKRVGRRKLRHSGKAGG
jgi:hypothetical protein